MTSWFGATALAMGVLVGCPTVRDGRPPDDDSADVADDDSAAPGDDDDNTAGDDDTTAGDDDDNLPPVTGHYGCGINADTLDNLPLGHEAGREVSYCFRASRTGEVESVQVWLIAAGPGYNEGDGGHVRLEVRPDDGSADHLPADEVLGTVRITDPMAQWNRRLELNSPAPIVEGELYHLVFSNPSSDPANNWVSLDGLHVARNEPQVQPTIDDTDLFVLYRRGTHKTWEPIYQVTPIFSMRFTDGSHDGQCYIDARQDLDFMNLGGDHMVREVFTPTGEDRVVTRVRIRLHRAAGEGDLTVRLSEDGGDLLDEVLVPTSEVGSEDAWIEVPWSHEHTLAAGTTYAVVLLAPEGTTYTAPPLQDGIYYGFECDSLFSDGHYEYRDGGGWTMIDNRTDFDLQFYFPLP